MTDETPNIAEWRISIDPEASVEDFGVAIIKVGIVEEDLDLLYVNKAYAAGLISGAAMQGWTVEPINFGYRVTIPGDDKYKFADLIDRKQAFDEAGIIL